MAEYSDIVGNIGVVLFLLAYFLLQKGWLLHTGLCYLWLNFAGSLLLLFSLMVHWNLSAFMLEAAWALISMYGMYRFWKNK